LQIPGQKTSTRAENQKGKNHPKRDLDDRASTQVAALTGHDLIQNVSQQTVNIVREDTRSDNSLVRQPTGGQHDRNIGQHPVTQTMDANERVQILYSKASSPQGHQNNSEGCIISDTSAWDTCGGMVI